ncbi:hypothetical protein [Flagellimonas sp.]|uniref:hypothetical protein n=1 Tax=Flagellimonas sp. TaxID=2058762 RepID=UPI003F4A38AF
MGQLFQMISKAFNKLGLAFLKVFIYLKKRAFIFGGLILLGLGVGYGLNQITEEKRKIEVIVKPNLNSENYLYDVVEEIQNNLKSEDIAFMESIGIPVRDVKQFKISVEPIEVDNDRKGDMELLEKFKDIPGFSDIVRMELLKNSALNHRIIFEFKEISEGKVFAESAMTYINSSDFFQRIIAISNENARTRIKQNEALIQQVDFLIKSYTESLNSDNIEKLDNRIQLDNEKPIDLTGLLQLKNNLIQNTERKKVELEEQQKAVNVLNFGKPQRIIKSFFGKRLVLIPLIFLGAFILFDFIKMVNAKAIKLGL